MKRLFILLAVMLTVADMVGCMPHTTGETQVGVRTRKLGLFGPKGVEQQVYAPGATYFFLPYINDWHVFDTKLQNLEMTFSQVRGDRRTRDDLVFKTTDGNDISLDVIIAYRIDANKAPHILQYVARDDKALRDTIVRTVARSTRFDYAIRVEGPLAKEIHNSARRVWSRVAWTRLRKGWRRGSDRQAPSTEPWRSKHTTFLVRDNIQHRRDIEDAYLQAIKQAQFEIILANAYFLPGLNFRHTLLDAAKRGVRVVLLLQGRADHRLLQYASQALYGSFLGAGIEIYEYHKSLMHAKVAVIDAHWATVGSSNLDPFSLLLSLEANVVVVDEDFANELKQSLDEAIRKGARRIFENSWSTQSFRLRLTSWLSYGLVRFLKGMAGYAPGKASGAMRAIWTSPSGSNRLWKR